MSAGGRDAVLAALRRGGAAEIAVIANRLGLHPTTVRAHLEALVEAGLVSRLRQRDPRGRGRPPFVYSALVAPATAGATGGYQGLATVLAGSFGQGSGSKPERARAAGRRWASDLDGMPDESAANRGSARAGVVRLVRDLDAMGFEPRPHAARGTTQIEMWSCPYLDAAREHPEVVCGVHRGLLEGLLERQVGAGFEIELVPFVTRDYCLASVRPVVGDAGQ